MTRVEKNRNGRTTNSNTALEQLNQCVHAFKLCKETLLILIVLTALILLDSDYQGIRDYHDWRVASTKKSKTRPLSEEQASNKELSRWRIVIENINSKIKVCKIMSILTGRNRLVRKLQVCHSRAGGNPEKQG